MRVFGALVALAVLTASAQADVVDDTKKADALFLKGREAFTANQFAEACELFFQAQQLQRENPAILINLGLCNEKQDRVASALRWYVKTQKLTSGKSDATYKEYEDTARERISALQPTVSKIRFELGTVQPNAELLIDGETIDRRELIVDVDRREHTIEVRAPGMLTFSEKLNVTENNKQLTYTFKALEPIPEGNTRSRRRLKGGVIGGGVVVVTTVATGLWANSIKKKFDDNPTDPGIQDDQRSRMKVATATFIGGVAVGVGIAAYFFFTKGSEERRTAFAPTVSHEGLGLAMFRRF